MHRIIAVMAFFGIATPLVACPIARVAVVRKVVVAPAVVVAAPVVQTVTVVKEVYIPQTTYTASYDEAGAALLTAINNGFKGLQSSIDRQTALALLPAKNTPEQVTTSPTPRTPTNTEDLRLFFLKKCAKCHQGDKIAALNGGAQVLLEEDGKLPPFSPAELNMIQFYVTGQTPTKRQCPPKAPLPKEEQEFVVKTAQQMRLDIRNEAKLEAAKPAEKK